MLSADYSPTSKTIYLPGLNGIRGLAALTVLLAHINDQLVFGKMAILPYLQLGPFAVSIFFALSGFLISYLLLHEKSQTGRVAITKFYMRRILRIWPMYFTYMLVAFIVGYFMGEETRASGFWITALFAQNTLPMLPLFHTYLGHYWSLSVEEQFYLFWPWLIAKSKHTGFVIAAFFVAYFALRMFFWFYLTEDSKPYLFMYATRFGCMAIGAFGAWLSYRGIPQQLKSVLFHPLMQALTWVVLTLVMLEIVPILKTISHQVIAALGTIIMLNLSQNPKTIIRLESPFWNFLGKISFGLYVWHFMLVDVIRVFSAPLDWNLWIKVPFYVLISIVASFAIATLSYYYLESPFLKLKANFSPYATKSDGKRYLEK